jgi:outer membrane protein assembly factor BamE (lipoprotein component of BamABCDE complex)
MQLWAQDAAPWAFRQARRRQEELMNNLNPIHAIRRPKGATRNWAAALSALVLLTAGCTPDINVRGNTVEQDRLTQIKPGVQDRSAVLELLGSPTNVATFNGETWYYISQKDHSIAFSKPKPIARRVVSISFNEAGRVAKVKGYSLADGRKIKPTERTTPTPGQEFGIIEQLLGNLGRFEQPSAPGGGGF